MYDYGPIAATATRLIAQFGRAVTLVVETAGGTPYAPTVSTTTATITAAVTSFKANEIDGTIVQADDKKLLTTSAVTVQNKITDGAHTYSVVSVETIKPGPTAVLYKAQLRK